MNPNQINMKKISFLTLMVVALTSCLSTQNLSKEELAKFSVKESEVFYNGEAVAKIGNLEYEYNRGRYQMEVSLVQYAGAYNEMTEKIARYVATKYPKAKIEVKVLRDDANDRPKP